MKISKTQIVLFLILLLAGFLRFVGIGSIPPSLTWDEVAWGYNAYSLGIDGRDEFGKLLPITYLESFGDFKPPLYAYLDILPIKIFGLTEFATRFPSALFGTLSVLLTYLLVLEIFGEKKKKLALLASFILAISPWHIMLSRAAFEANVAHFFILFGLLSFLFAIRKNLNLIPLSVVSFVLSMYTFNTARIVVPILVLVLAFVFHRKLLRHLKITIISFLIGFFMFIPLLLFLNTPQAKLRYEEVNIFSDIGIIERVNQQVENDGNSYYSKFIHNRRLAYGVQFLRHYFDNLNPAFLFIQGDGNPKFSIQDVGQLYIWEIPFIAIGALILFRRRKGYWWLVPILIVVGIFPAGFARETPHALRIENTLPAFQILTAIGVLYALSRINKYKKLAIVILSIIVFLNFSYFAHNYVTHYSREFSGQWQYGYKESIEYVNSKKDKYDSIYITERLGRPYIYYLFYLKYDPKIFREEKKVYREVLGFVHVNSFRNFQFVERINSIDEKGALYIAYFDEVPENVNILREFRLLNGMTQLVAYTK